LAAVVRGRCRHCKEQLERGPLGAGASRLFLLGCEQEAALPLVSVWFDAIVRRLLDTIRLRQESDVSGW
jgi:hypothetical protein